MKGRKQKISPQCDSRPRNDRPEAESQTAQPPQSHYFEKQWNGVFQAQRLPAGIPAGMDGILQSGRYGQQSQGDRPMATPPNPHVYMEIVETY